MFEKLKLAEAEEKLDAVMLLVEAAKKNSKSYELASAIMEIPGIGKWWRDYKKEKAARLKAEREQELEELADLEREHAEKTKRLVELRARHGKPPFTSGNAEQLIGRTKRTRSTAVNKEEPVRQQRVRRKAVATSATEEMTKQYVAKTARNKKPEAVSTTTQNAKRGRPRKTVTAATRNVKGKGK